jgi:hypothetical protein
MYLRFLFSFPILAGATGLGAESRVNPHTPHVPSATYTLSLPIGAHFLYKDRRLFPHICPLDVKRKILLRFLIGHPVTGHEDVQAFLSVIHRHGKRETMTYSYQCLFKAISQ